MPLQSSPPVTAFQDVEVSPPQLVMRPGWRGWLSSALVLVGVCWSWVGRWQAPPLPAALAVMSPLPAAHLLPPQTQGSALLAACDFDGVKASSVVHHQPRSHQRGGEP